MTIKVGITGLIGMGKSTVASIFAENDIPIWDADREVHKLYKKNNKGYKVITSRIPELINKKEINRKKLSNLIKEGVISLNLLESLIHPLLADSRKRFIIQNKNKKFIIFDIPLLFETSADKWLDYVILVYCSKKTQIRRLSMRKNYDKDKIDYLLSKQLNFDKKKEEANFIIDTDKKIEIVEKRVLDIIKDIVQK